MSSPRSFTPYLFLLGIMVVLGGVMTILIFPLLSESISCLSRIIFIILTLIILGFSAVFLRNIRRARLIVGQSLTNSQKFFWPEFLFFVIVLAFFFGLGIILPQSLTLCQKDFLGNNKIEPIEETKTKLTQQNSGQVPNNGPYLHDIYFATSQDGISWVLNDEVVAEHASVPELIELNQALNTYTKGTLLSYFVDASEMAEPGSERIGLVASNDGGKTWSKKKNINISGLDEEMIPVDPSVFQLTDGRLRLYFFDIMGGFSDQRNQETNSKPSTGIFYSAVSEDGENFVFEGESFSAAAATDPEVIYFNEQWLMYYAGAGGVHLALSSDGQTFTESGSLNMPGVPGVMVVDDKVYLYTCQQGVSYAISSDGKNFSQLEQTSGFTTDDEETAFCDGGPVALSSGGYVMMMKSLPTVFDSKGMMSPQGRGGEQNLNNNSITPPGGQMMKPEVGQKEN